MIDVIKLRSLYESHVGPRDAPSPRGRTAFVHRLRNWLGLCDERGNDYKDRHGNRQLRESKVDPGEFSVQEIALATCGDRVYRQFFDPSRKSGLYNLHGHNALLESQHPGDGRALLEAAGVGVDVSAFADINAWTAATGGLIERKILEAFQNPEYIGDELMVSENTKIAEGQKIIGVSRIGDKAAERQPGQAHQRAGLIERWVQLGKTRENSLAVDVFKEAAFFDLTGQLLDHAGQHGDWLRYRKEIDQLSAYAGVTTQIGGRWQFNYGGVAYNTYAVAGAITPANPNGSQLQPSGRPIGYVTQLANNDLVDWKSYEQAWLILQRQLDPETGTRVQVRPDTVVVMPARVATAKLIFGATETERRTSPGATQATSGDLHVLRAPGNVVDAFGVPSKVMWSPLLEQILTNSAADPVSPGLGLTQSQANAYWFWFAKSRFMRYMVNWPLTIVQVPATEYDMVDRGIVASFFGDERGMPAVVSPWHMLLSTG